MSATTLDMTPQKEAAITNHLNERDRVEENAPRFDVEYLVSAPSRKNAVSEAHSDMMDDLGDKVSVVTNTTIVSESKYHCSVVIRVAADVTKEVFQSAEVAYLVDN